jgi:hypothetical protein
MPDIKDLLDSIIKDNDKDYSDKRKAEEGNSDHVKFDRVNFREKLSLYVLRDLISAMMHDDTKDLDNMIDSSVMRHINHNYGGSCYDYLKSSCEKLQSPLIGDIIMEIENECDRVEQEVYLTKNPNCIEEAALKTKELLESCDNYEEFRQNLMNKVSKDIVDDVTNVVVNGNEAPVFDDLDASLNKKSKEDKEKEKKEAEENENKDEDQKTPETQDQQPNQASETPADQVKSESVILKMSEAIVTESYVKEHRKMSTEEGLNRAIIEYCIVQMDGLFKQNPKQDGFDRYLKW